MLLYFRTANSRSFDEEVEFSMIAGDYGDKLLRNTVPLDKYGISVLKSSAIYGANASGKSNLLQAMTDGLHIILGIPKELKFSYHDELHHFYNKNRETNRHKPTLYVFGILTDDTAFEYTFSNTSERIYEEKLTEQSPKEAIIHFHRTYNSRTNTYDWTFSDAFAGKISETVREFMVKKNNLFLSSAANLPEDKTDRLPIADKIYQWFRKKIMVRPPSLLLISDYHLSLSLNLIKNDEKAKQLFLQMLEQTDFIIKNIVMEDENGTLSVKTYHEGTDADGGRMSAEYDFFREESAGTRRFLAWFAPFYLSCFQNRLLLADELDTSMHLLLTEYLTEWFHRNTRTGQLIFTTHDVKLMNSRTMRKDQFWIVHRDRAGNSSLEPVSNYDIDDDKLLDNVYLQGILGGIPEIRKGEAGDD